MSVLIRNFKHGDLGKIDTNKPVPVDRDSIYYPRMEELGRTMLEISRPDKPLAAWGMQPHWEGVASVWSEFSDYGLKHYPLAIAKNVKRHLNEHIEMLHLHRVQSFIFEEDETSIHWIQWLGFHQEGLLEEYLKGVNVLIFARIIH